MDMDVQQVKLKIKRWEHAFIAEHNRPPDKDDIRPLTEMKQLYKLYSVLKSKERKAEPIQKQQTPRKDSNMVLGPTPQIYGKAVSIFEMKVSPLKVEETPTTEVEEDIESEIESSVNRRNSDEASANEEKLGIHSVKKRLFESPKKTENTTHLAVPQVTRYGPNSPLKLAQTVSIRQHLLTPKKKKAEPKSLYTPSPLLKRNSSKTLYELAHEHLQYVKEIKELDQQFKSEIVPIRHGNGQDIGDESDEVPEKKKRRTGVLRRLQFDEDENDRTIKKDLHKELLKLKSRKVKEFLGKEDNEPSEEEEEEQQKSEPLPVKKKRPKKYNLVSNNFRRLKLPKKNRNPRFGRRR